MKKISAKEYQILSFYRKSAIVDKFTFLSDIKVGEHWKIERVDWTGKQSPSYLTSVYKRLRKEDGTRLKIRTLLDKSGWVVSCVEDDREEQ